MRARNIKPDFFRDAELAEVSLESRYLFIGLWCLADREGKLKDNPKQIRFEIFPETKTRESVDALLNQLQDHNLICRYIVDEIKYIKVRNFLKHQSPHNTEKSSTYPDPPLPNGDLPLSNVNIALNPDLLNPELGILNTDSLTKAPRKSKKSETPIPDDFGISDAVRTWAAEKGFTRLEDHLEWFKDWALGKRAMKADWDATFRNAIRGDWAKLGQGPQRQLSKADQITAGNLAARERAIAKIGGE